GTCRHQDHFVVGVVIYIFEFNDGIGGYVKVSQFGCDTHVVDHGTAYKSDLATIFDCGIEHLLYTVYMLGKRGHNDPSLCLADMLFDNRTDVFFRGGKSWNFSVGRVGHE